MIAWWLRLLLVWGAWRVCKSSGTSGGALVSGGICRMRFSVI
jgi:hypothetical protein